MKKFTATLLSVCLAFQMCTSTVPVSAAALSVKTETTDQGTASEEASLEIEVFSSSRFPYQGDVKVAIHNKTEKQEKMLTFTDTAKEQDRSKDVKPDSALAKFPVSAGEYTVTITARNFATYKQSITVKAGQITKIQVCPFDMESENEKRPGWFCVGDVTDDGMIDDKDQETLLSAVREQPDNTDYDLNQDGKTDLADLQAMVLGLDGQKDSYIEILSLPKDVKIINNTQIKMGSAEKLLNAGESITLQTANSSEISENNPVGLEFNLTGNNASQAPEIEGIVIKAPASTNKNGNISSTIEKGTITVVSVDSDGKEISSDIPLAFGSQTKIAKVQAKKAKTSQKAKKAASAVVDANGSILVNFQGQIPVKRVVIKVTDTLANSSLCEIAKVEFVNNMDQRIPAPQLNIPTLNDPKSGNQQLSVSWKAQNNVTGYELMVSAPADQSEDVLTAVIPVASAAYTISAIENQPLVNFKTYTIKVRSVNGDWKSPWSEEKTGTPKPQKKPDAPDYVKAEGGYRSMQVSWKAMDDSNGYMVYYKKSGDSQYQPVVKDFEQTPNGTGKLTENHYTITGLEDNVEYSVYVIGWNELGWGKQSLVSVGTTKVSAKPELPNYKLLNTSNGVGKVTAHIKEAVMGGSGASMVASPLDTEKNSALGLVDDDYASYWCKADWDDGVAYPAQSKGMSITLDNNYKMNYFTFAAADQKARLERVLIEYWTTENGAESKAQKVGARLIGKTDVNDNPYYIVKLDETIYAHKIRMCLGRIYGNKEEMKVGEIHFHQYDSLEDDIMGLYTDEMHTTLRADVTESKIQELEARLEIKDTQSGEKHPLYDELKLELKTARQILTSDLDPAVIVSNTITAQKDKHLGFGGLNAWQPLGKVGYAGETLLVYVGHNTKRTGDAANLQLVYTQYHSESDSLSGTISLKVGRNEITIPALSNKDCERGGQLYIAYTGNDPSDQYAVRISGGSKIPVLNLYGKSGEARTAAITAYLTELGDYVKIMEAEHGKQHTDKHKNVNYTYDQTNCILNATDIMMESMMYSLPATQVLAGLGNASNQVTKLDNALKAMEDTMTLFYQHKGLSKEAGTEKGNNNLPAQHLNIRYMRMFAGAFMYASGNHIGIEWGSCKVASAPDNWDGLGWGIAHEIGHDINQGTYAIAEITNNYFAQLLTKESNGKTRFDYKDVYKKVTSGTTGRSSNVFTQLALYWQLHLAFDNQKDRHIFDHYDDQFNQLFFARVDTYSRNPDKAPQSGLTLGNDVDQNLMRLACAAANKNILPFFERWGMVPDEATIEYAGKYGERDTKALYYVNDDARDYRAAHSDETGTIKGKDVVTATSAAKSNQVEITITTNQNADAILGYEIIRSMTSKGKKQSQVVGFQPIDTAASTVFTDTVYSVNNRVMAYEVRAVDKFLNYSNTVDAGSVKIQTEGILDKAAWTVETTMTSKDDTAINTDENDPDSGFENAGAKKVHSIDRILDQDKTENGTYHGNSDGTAVITIDMHKTEPITALKYAGDSLPSITIEASDDQENWITLKENYTGLKDKKEAMIWFDSVKEDSREDWIGTYDMRYIRLSIPKSGALSIQEIDICSPSGDNLEFMAAGNGQNAIGKLTQDYRYGDKPDQIIPKGSLIFTGTYKGNPAYNVVLLYDMKGNLIGEKDGKVYAEQIILADVPKDGNLGETSDGTWVYYVLPDQWDEDSLKKLDGVRGELYRVDNPLTLEGERIVSDTKMITIDTIPDITLTD